MKVSEIKVTQKLEQQQALQLNQELRAVKDMEEEWVGRYELFASQGKIERATAPLDLAVDDKEFNRIQNNYKREIKRLARYELDRVPCGLVLDCGTGVCHLADVLVEAAKRGHQILGIDIALPALEYSRPILQNKLNEAGLGHISAQKVIRYSSAPRLSLVSKLLKRQKLNVSLALVAQMLIRLGTVHRQAVLENLKAYMGDSGRLLICEALLDHNPQYISQPKARARFWWERQYVEVMQPFRLVHRHKFDYFNNEELSILVFAKPVGR